MGRGALRRETEFGQEQFCHQCDDWWPATTEFFYIMRGSMTSPCKACIAEAREINNADKPCSVPGCNKPRHKTLTQTRSRCFEHWQEQMQAFHLRRYGHRQPRRTWIHQEVDEIKTSELTLTQLAKKFNVSITTIFRIKHKQVSP